MSKNPISRTAPLAALLLALVPLILAGCEATPKNYREYKNKDTSYYRGDLCEERYQLYDDGTYERYIYGTYMGKELKSRMYGTLFETGTYIELDKPSEAGEDEENEGEEEAETEETVNEEPWGITFTSLKQYDFDTERLVGLGTETETRAGTISDTKLTVEYKVKYTEDYFGYEYDYYKPLTLTYTRNW